MDKRKILFVNDTSSDNNLGCNATTNALYELIDEHLPEYRVSDVIYLDETEHPSIAPMVPLKAEDFDEYAHLWVENKQQSRIISDMLKKIHRCDVVLLNGEGSIYKDVLKGRFILFFSYISKVFCMKPTYIVNHTADTGMVRELVTKTYPLLDGIVVREPLTLKELTSIGILENVHLAPDVIFKYRVPEKYQLLDRLPSGFEIERPFVIVGGSSLSQPIYEKWYGKWNMDGYRKIVDYLVSHMLQVLLIDVGGDIFLRGIAREKQVFYINPCYKDYLFICSKALLHISGRHHGTCLASIASCPVIGISSNTKKVKGDLDLLDWDIPVFDFYRLEQEFDSIAAYIERVVNSNNLYREKLRVKVEEIRRDIPIHVTVLREHQNSLLFEGNNLKELLIANLAEKDKQIISLKADIQEKVAQIHSIESHAHSLELHIHQLERSIPMQLVRRYQRIVDRLLRTGTRRRYCYELGLTDIRVILNEGWRSFFREVKSRPRGRKERASKQP